MTPENFVYWLQGFLEIQNPKIINEDQIQEIQNHISLVLNKVTPFKVNTNNLPTINLGYWKAKNLSTNKTESISSIPNLTGYVYSSEYGGYILEDKPEVVYIQPCASC